MALSSDVATSSKPRKALCPGSFDPVTNGHIDVISRASALYDEVVVCVLVNTSKARQKTEFFTAEERCFLLKQVTAQYHNVTVDTFSGLLVDYCRKNDIPVLIKGLRAVSDFDYELQMAQMNNELGGIETLFLPTNPLHSFLSSSLVKEVAAYGGDISSHVPDIVRRYIVERLAAIEKL